MSCRRYVGGWRAHETTTTTPRLPRKDRRVMKVARWHMISDISLQARDICRLAAWQYENGDRFGSVNRFSGQLCSLLTRLFMSALRW